MPDLLRAIAYVSLGVFLAVSLQPAFAGRRDRTQDIVTQRLILVSPDGSPVLTIDSDDAGAARVVYAKVAETPAPYDCDWPSDVVRVTELDLVSPEGQDVGVLKSTPDGGARIQLGSEDRGVSISSDASQASVVVRAFGASATMRADADGARFEIYDGTTTIVCQN